MPIAKTGKADIWWDSTGEGSPIIMVNGLSSPSSVWFRIAPLLSVSHRVIVFDNIGTGRSGTPSEAWELRDMADAIGAVLDAAGETRAAVLGMSLGGLIAEEFALEHLDRVSSLILVSTHAGMSHIEADPAVVAALTDSGSLPPDERTEILMSFTYAAATPKSMWAEDAVVRAEQPTSPEGYQGQIAAANPWDRIDDLPTITVPTLVLHGAEDRMVPLSAAQLLAAQLPNSQTMVLSGAGHQLFTDQTEAGAKIVLAFLKENEG